MEAAAMIAAVNRSSFFMAEFYYQPSRGAATQKRANLESHRHRGLTP